MSGASLVRVAAVQATPVFLDLAASLDKACRLIAEAAAAGASLIVFPEAFLPSYPVWPWFVPAAQTQRLRELYVELHTQSITIPGPAVTRIAEAAVSANVSVAIGVNERNSEASDGSLYNTLLIVDASGDIVGRHRKLIPTSAERMVWARGDGSDLDVWAAPFGRVGGLICWENYMPLARHALASWGAQIHLAPTWDRGEPWISSMRHIAKESRCYVISCCQAFHMNDIPDRYTFKQEYLGGLEGWLNRGQSLIVDPDGKIIAGPADSEETILYADLDPALMVGPRWQLDTAGHYSRPDVFELVVHRTPRPQVRIEP